MSENDKFWTEDTSVLYNMNTIFDIIPNNNMTREEQLNAITRFCIYFIILLYLTENDSEWIKLPVIIIIFVVILFYIYKNDNNSKFKEFYRNKINKKKVKSLNNDDEYNYNEEYLYKKNNLNEKRDYDLKVLNSLEEESDKSLDKMKKINDIEYSREEIEEFDNNNCRIPTRNNPFMNITQDELNKPNIPKACNVDDEKIKDDIENKFNDEIFRDIDDLYNIKNSQRQFYTIPVSNYMPDTKKFAEWCYKMPLNCKSNQENCLKYEDLKYK